MMASHIIIVKFYHHRNIVIVIVNASVKQFKCGRSQSEAAGVEVYNKNLNCQFDWRRASL